MASISADSVKSGLVRSIDIRMTPSASSEYYIDVENRDDRIGRTSGTKWL